VGSSENGLFTISLLESVEINDFDGNYSELID
jgi:hypothetical protein